MWSNEDKVNQNETQTEQSFRLEFRIFFFCKIFKFQKSFFLWEMNKNRRIYKIYPKAENPSQLSSNFCRIVPVCSKSNFWALLFSTKKVKLPNESFKSWLYFICLILQKYLFQTCPATSAKAPFVFKTSGENKKRIYKLLKTFYNSLQRTMYKKNPAKALLILNQISPFW